MKKFHLVLMTLAMMTGPAAVHAAPQIEAPAIGGCPIFPANNFWNVPVDDLPVHPQSAAWINSIGSNDGFHMDFGSGTWDGGPIGIPYNVASGATFYNFNFYYPSESDPGPYPIPNPYKREHGSDHHILVVEQNQCKLYEIYDASLNGSQGSGGSGAVWDLSSNTLRPDTWTSADAAGLPILPGLARYDEVAQGVIEHALRFTANCTANYYIWPARHKAQHGSCATPVPFGARFRLKEGYNISGFSPQAQVLLQAFKTYGIVLADNGSDWYVSGEPNQNWNNSQLHELDVLKGSDFEAVDTSVLMVNPNSAETNYSSNPYVVSIQRTQATPTNAASIGYTVTFSGNVSGVGASDFSLQITGNITGAGITGVSGSGSTYTVSVNTGSGDGTLRLDLIDDDSIAAEGAADKYLGGVGAGNGDFQGGVYTVDKTPPTVISITRLGASPTSAFSISYLVTFSEDIAGLNIADFSLNVLAGNVDAVLTAVSGGASSYVVRINTGRNDNGTLRLDLMDDDSVTDLAGNGLTSGFTGAESYVIEKPVLPAPSLSAPRRGSVTNDATPLLRWLSVNGAAGYEVELAADADFTSVILTSPVPATSYTPGANLAEGVYYWHARAVDGYGRPGQWSNTYSFIVDTTGPAAPVLLFPQNSSTKPGRGLVFRWASVVGAAGYEFRYDNDADCGSPIRSIQLRGTSQRIASLSPGTYYWCARARDGFGNWGGWSAPFMLIIP